MATKEEIQKGITAANQQVVDIQHGNIPQGQTREQALAGIKSNLETLNTQAGGVTEPTVGSMFGTQSVDDKNLSDLEKKEYERLTGIATKAPSQEDIYSGKLASYQQEIDALNAAAAARKAEVATQLQKVGEKSLAQAGAVGARRGLLGSTFQAGTEAGIAGETAQNIREAQSVVDTQYQEKIAALRGQARQAADEEYQTKLKAYEEGGSALIKFLQEKKTRRSSAVSSLVSSMIDADYSDEDIKQIALERGIPENELKEAYKAARLAFKREEEKSALEAEKTRAEIEAAGTKVLGEGDIYVDRNGNIIARGPAKTLSPTESAALSTAQAAKESAQALKDSARESAKALLEKFNAEGGKRAVGFGGPLLSAAGQLIGGTQAGDFKTQFNNLKSLLSLDNVKYLKGQGQVSDAERALLSQASAKLELSQSESEFKKALEDIVSSLSGESDASTESGPIRITRNGVEGTIDSMDEFDPSTDKKL